MKAVINNFRGSRRRKSERQMIIIVEGIGSKESAKALVGKTVSWTAPGKNKTTITGKISAAHGNSGALRAIFEKGMPGQAIGQQIEVV